MIPTVGPGLPQTQLEAVCEPGAGDEAGQEPRPLVRGEGGDGRHQEDQGHHGVRGGGEPGEQGPQLPGQADKSVCRVMFLSFHLILLLL